MGHQKFSNIKAYLSESDQDGVQRLVLEGTLCESEMKSEDRVAIAMIVRDDAQTERLSEKKEVELLTSTPELRAYAYPSNVELSGAKVELYLTPINRKQKHLLAGFLDGIGSQWGSSIPFSLEEGVQIKKWSVNLQESKDDLDFLRVEANLEVEGPFHELKWRLRLLTENGEEITAHVVGAKSLEAFCTVSKTFTLARQWSQQRVRVESHVELSVAGDTTSHHLPILPDLDYDLIIACRDGDAKKLDDLIEAGISANQTDEIGTHCIHWATQGNHFDVVQRLINEGVDTEVTDAKGRTTLSRAALMGHVEITRYLLSSGANFRASSSNGNDALSLAAWNGHVDVIRLLYGAGAEVDPRAVARAAERGHVEVIQFLCEEAIRDDRLEYRSQATATAAGANQEAIVSYLTETASESKLEECVAGLMAAANRGHLSLVQQLFPMVQDIHRQSARQFAERGQWTELLKWMDGQSVHEDLSSDTSDEGLEN